MKGVGRVAARIKSNVIHLSRACRSVIGERALSAGMEGARCEKKSFLMNTDLRKLLNLVQHRPLLSASLP